MEGENSFVPSAEQIQEAEIDKLLKTLGDLLPKMDSVPLEQIKTVTAALEKQLTDYPAEKKNDAFFLGAESSLREAKEQLEARMAA